MKRKPKQKKKLIGKKEVIVVITAVILTVAGIKAADNYIFTDEGGNSGCGADMVYVTSPGGGFCVDMYEVSADANCPHSDPASQLQTKQNLEKADCRGRSIAGAMPWRNISQNQAAVVCAKSGKRLPTNKEWLLAAMGTPDSGNESDASDCQVNNNWTEQPGKTGSGKNCLSGNGAYDMIGNAWEWVDGTISDGYFGETELPAAGYIAGLDDRALPSKTLDAPDENYNRDFLWIKNTGVRGIARGGYWGNGEEAGQYSVYMVSEPAFAGTGVGFRCVK